MTLARLTRFLADPGPRGRAVARLAEARCAAAARHAFAIEHDPLSLAARLAGCRARLAETADGIDRAADLAADFTAPVAAHPAAHPAADSGVVGDIDATAEALAIVAVAAQRSLGLRPHRAQLTAAAIALGGGIAEVPTGEGHLLSLVVAACVRASAGVPVDIVLRQEGQAVAALARYRPLFDLLDLPVAVATAPTLGSPVAAGAGTGTGTGEGAEVRIGAGAEAEARIGAGAEAEAEAGAGRRDARILFTSPARLLADGGFARPGPVIDAAAFLTEADRLLVDGARFRGAVDGRPDRQSAATLGERLRRYRWLGGVSATAVEVGAEIERTYRLAVVPIESIYPAFERDLGWRVLVDRPSQQHWLIERIVALRAARRPVLVLAADADECRELAALLASRGIEPVRCDLAAGDPRRLAFAAADAGRARAVSLHCLFDPAPATIVAEPLARAAGGLAVIATVLGADRRQDRHNAGRVGHQGEPGTLEAVLDAGRPLRLAGRAVEVPALARLAAAGLPQPLLAAAIRARRHRLASRLRRLREPGRPGMARDAVDPDRADDPRAAGPARIPCP